MRVIRGMRRHDPKLSVSTRGKIARREARIERLMLQPDRAIRAYRIARVVREIDELVRADYARFDAERERKPRLPPEKDRRTVAYRMLHSPRPDDLDAIRAAIRADAELAGVDLAPSDDSR